MRPVLFSDPSQRVLRSRKGNKAETARVLGIDRRTL
ncbi:MAG: hypothetical protein H0V80_03675 [Acidobacteria bacterium]|nr:hypothetical protein [Acidobacteriota bacterium]